MTSEAHEAESPRRRTNRRVGLALAVAALGLAAGGGFWFRQFVTAVGRDPAVVYRDPATLDRLLKRGADAESVGDRGAAIVAYRFVVAVGGREPGALAPYVARARAALSRLGASDTLPGRPR